MPQGATSDSIVLLKTQIYSMVSHLVPIFTKIGKDVKPLSKLINFYVEMSHSKLEDELLMLQHVCKYGDTSVNAWHHA